MHALRVAVFNTDLWDTGSALASSVRQPDEALYTHAIKTSQRGDGISVPCGRNPGPSELRIFSPVSDPSWNTVTGSALTENLIGPIGAYLADLFLQAFGLAAFAFPVLMFALGWKWIRSEPLPAPAVKLIGSGIIVISLCGLAALLPDWRLFDRSIPPGGATGFLTAGLLRQGLNLMGTAVVLATAFIVSIYLVSKFELKDLEAWFAPVRRLILAFRDVWRGFLAKRRAAAMRRVEQRAEKQAEKRAERAAPVVAEAAKNAPERRVSAGARGCSGCGRSFGHSKDCRESGSPTWRRHLALGRPRRLPRFRLSLWAGEIPICRLDEAPPAESSNVLEFPFTKAKTKVSAQRLPTLYPAAFDGVAE